MVYRVTEPHSIETVEQLLNWVQEELRKISQEMVKSSGIQFQVLNVAPDKPRDGMLVVADGTNWNPGAGAGIYLRIGAAWTKL